MSVVVDPTSKGMGQIRDMVRYHGISCAANSLEDLVKSRDKRRFMSSLFVCLEERDWNSQRREEGARESADSEGLVGLWIEDVLIWVSDNEEHWIRDLVA
jgi:hypothetical protein